MSWLSLNENSGHLTELQLVHIQPKKIQNLIFPTVIFKRRQRRRHRVHQDFYEKLLLPTSQLFPCTVFVSSFHPAAHQVQRSGRGTHTCSRSALATAQLSGWPPFTHSVSARPADLKSQQDKQQECTRAGTWGFFLGVVVHKVNQSSFWFLDKRYFVRSWGKIHWGLSPGSRFATGFNDTDSVATQKKLNKSNHW